MDRQGVGLHGTRRTPYRVTFFVLCLSVCAYAMLQSLILPVLPLFEAGLHTSLSAVSWMLTAYLLSASICTPILGRLGDMFGKDRMLLVAIGALALGCVLGALAPTIGVMIVARAIQGAGGGALPLAFGIIRDEFPEEKMAGAVGFLAGLTAAASAVGIVLAGPIVHAFNYHFLFWIPGIALVAAGVATYFVVPPSPTRVPGRVNPISAILLATWLTALLLGLSKAPEWGWTSAKVLSLLVASLLIAVAWVVYESTTADPLIDMKMMRLPAIWSTNLVALLFGAGLYAGFIVIPAFLETTRSHGYGFGTSVSHAGLVLLPGGLVMFVVSLASGRLTTRLGGKTLLVVGSMLSVFPYLFLTFFHGEEWFFFLAMASQGLGFGLAFAAMSVIVVESVPESQTGVASGMNANIRTIGGSIGAAAVGSIVASNLHADGVPMVSGYVHSYLLLALTTVGAALASLLVPSSTKRLSAQERHDALLHPELGIVAAGTLAGADSE